MLLSSGGPSEGPQGLLWILDEEALMQSSSDSRALDRLCSAFRKEGKAEGESLGNASCIGKGIKGSPSELSLCPTKARGGLAFWMPQRRAALEPFRVSTSMACHVCAAHLVPNKAEEHLGIFGPFILPPPPAEQLSFTPPLHCRAGGPAQV